MKKHIVIVSDEWFLENLQIFSNTEHCKVSRSFIEDDTFKDDPVHKKLWKAKKKATEDYYNYEFDKRTNHKHK